MIKFTETEVKYLEGHPDCLRLLAIYHDIQQTMADACGAECYGNEIRMKELEAEAKRIEESW